MIGTTGATSRQMPFFTAMRQQYIIILTHIAAWLLFFSLINGFVFRDTQQQDIVSNILSGRFLLFCVSYLFIFYFNTYILIPKLFLMSKQVQYFGSMLLLFVLVLWLKPFEQLMIGQRRPGPEPIHRVGYADRPPPPGSRSPLRPTDVTGIVLFIAVWSLSSAICVARQWRLNEMRANRAEADKANAELSFLKMQINPHFLFNTLNNIYMLAVSKDDNTPSAILKLSNMMRYLTDEVQEDLVPLQNEVDCVRDYIDLQRLRLNKNTGVHFNVDGDLTGKEIAPLLLMTFIENTFKHGISNHDPADIHIRLVAEPKFISFYAQNKLFAVKRNTERTGIGISNAKQRLEHMYPGKHSLIIKTADNLYSVHLTVQV